MPVQVTLLSPTLPLTKEGSGLPQNHDRISADDLTGTIQQIAEVVQGQLSGNGLTAIAGDVSIGDLTADQKRDLFRDLAISLNGDQLATVSHTMASGADRAYLAEAILTHSVQETRTDFIRSTLNQSLPDQPPSGHVDF